MPPSSVGPGAPHIDPALVTRYAEVVVRGCADLQPGERVVLSVEPAHRQLAVALAEQAYAAGAEWVALAVNDTYVTRARLEHGGDDALGGMSPVEEAVLRASIGPDSVMIHVTGEADLGVLDRVPGARQALDLQRRQTRQAFFREAQREGRTRFVIVGWPTVAWAEQVFPELTGEAAGEALMADLAAFARIDGDDPVAAVRAHCRLLETRAGVLDGAGLERLELRGPGTHLDVGVPPDVRWCHVGMPNVFGRRDVVNWPSEEVFTSPDPARATGTFTCTRPLTFQGRTIRELRGELVDGRLVHAEAADPDALAALLGYLDADDTGRRLGEVALVDATSPIAQTGRTYHDTLYDENAACHIAFGFGFDFARRPGAGGDPSPVNRSLAHVDVMIGSDRLDVTGVTRDGGRLAIIEAGRFQIGD